MARLDKIFIASLTAVLCPFLAWDAVASPIATRTQTVMLSEIMCHGGSRWVELANYGTNDVEIRGWTLETINGRSYRFPSNLDPVPTNGVVLLMLAQGHAGRLGERFAFSGGVPAVLLWEVPPETLDVKQGMCSLYDAESNIVDFVAWGNTNATPAANNVAVKAGIWPVSQRITVWVKEGGIRYHGPPPMDVNGSIARLTVSAKNRLSDWTICASDNVSEGKRNEPPAPTLDYGPGEGTLLRRSEVVNLAWKGKGETFRVQVARTDDFKELLLDEVVHGQVKKIERGLDKGSYYWRVRTETSGMTGKWSKSLRFEVKE